MNSKLALNLLLATVIVAVVIGGVVLLFQTSDSSEGVVVTLPEPTVAIPSTPAPTTIRVHVSGEVNQPGVYELPIDSRADDALQAAGGPTSDAKLDQVNLARRLSDEEQLHIPGPTEEITSTSSAPEETPTSVPAGKIDLNTATVAQLDTLPNIGPSRAQAIVDHRETNGPFRSVEDLVSVSGIGEGILNSVRDLVEVR